MNNKDTFNVAFVKKTYEIADKDGLANFIIEKCKIYPKLKYLSTFKSIIRLSSYPEYNAVLCGKIKDYHNVGKEKTKEKIIKFLEEAENKLNKEF
jgi:AAA+ superfamily predicted ATPase